MCALRAPIPRAIFISSSYTLIYLQTPMFTEVSASSILQTGLIIHLYDAGAQHFYVIQGNVCGHKTEYLLESSRTKQWFWLEFQGEWEIPPAEQSHQSCRKRTHKLCPRDLRRLFYYQGRIRRRIVPKHRHNRASPSHCHNRRCLYFRWHTHR